VASLKLIRTIAAALVLVSGGPSARAAAAAPDYWMYVGTYTSRGGRGIYLYRFHSATGTVESKGLAAGRFWEANADASWSSLSRMFSQIRVGWPSVASMLRGVQNPVYFALHPNGQYLYTADELPSPSVSAFRIDPATGKLTTLNTRPSGGKSPTFVAIDKSGKDVLVANYDGADISVLPVGNDGYLRDAAATISYKAGANGRASHPHSINLSPDNRFALVADLGLDRIYVYRFDAASGILTPNDPPFLATRTGAGARHLVFHPNGRFVWLIEEAGSSIETLEWDAVHGVLTPRGSVRTIPDDYHDENATAEILVHPGGKFLYGSNRGHDSIAVFTINEATGALSPVEYIPTRGSRPRGFAIDPSGQYLFAANVETENVVEFKIDKMTGHLTMTGTILHIPFPEAIKFAPTANQ
jgi:6-phosphogluconolactonase